MPDKMTRNARYSDKEKYKNGLHLNVISTEFMTGRKT
jgi:hypothetical protein